MFGVAGDDEDDYADFKSPASGSRLASLFGSDGGVGQNAVETFRFQAPKQPKAGKNSRTGPALGQQDPNPESDNNEGTKSAAKQAAASGNVLHAVPVHAFLFVNGQYKAQGRLGAAVVGNFSIREYKLWLYVTQQRPVTTARIHPDFTITVQKDHYCSFHDDRRQPWSLLFASHTAVCEFVTQVCLARWFSSSQEMKRPMTQDLAQGEGPTLEEGDTVEVEFTGWLLGNGKLGKVFDGNSDKEKGLRFRLGKGKVLKGWEKGVLGMRKDGQRLILVPSSLGYGERGLAGHVPPNANLAFNILIKRWRSRKNGSSDKQSTSSQESATPSPVPTTFEQQAESLLIPPMTVPGPPGWDRLSDESVRSRSQSLSEQLKHADTTKATLISRMARVGQPMLPQLPARMSPLDTCSDSDTEDLDKHAPTTHADKLPTMISQPQPTSQSQPQPQPQAMPRFQDSSGNPHAQHHPIQLVSRPFVDPESRPSSQHLFAASSNYPFAYVPSTAPAALPSFPPAQQLLLPGMADLAWLVGEMRQHHTDIRLTMGGLSERLDSLGHKVEDVSLNTRQLLDSRPESCGQQQMDRTRLAQLEDDKLHLSREKDKVMVQLQVLEEELKSVKSNLEETQEELKKSKRERDELDSKSEETEKHLQETRADLHQALEQGEFLRTRTVVMKRKFEEELQKRTEDESTQVVKQAMNAVYRCLRHQFAPDQTYSGKGVLNCVIAALKNTMMNIVQGGGSEGHDDEGGTEEEHEDSLKKEDEQERMGGTEEECSNCQSEATPEFAENDVNALQPPPLPDAECDDGDHQSCS